MSSGIIALDNIGLLGSGAEELSIFFQLNVNDIGCKI